MELDVQNGHVVRPLTIPNGMVVDGCSLAAKAVSGFCAAFDFLLHLFLFHVFDGCFTIF